MIYTSRYGNPNVLKSRAVAVGITRYPPRFDLPYPLVANLYALAPTTAMLERWRSGGSDRDELFARAYLVQLNELGAERILRMIQGFGDEVVVLCYEDLGQPGEWCHRRLLASWLNEHVGVVIDEFPDPGSWRHSRNENPQGAFEF